MPDDLEGWISWVLVWEKEDAEKWEYDFVKQTEKRKTYICELIYVYVYKVNVFHKYTYILHIFTWKDTLV